MGQTAFGVVKGAVPETFAVIETNNGVLVSTSFLEEKEFRQSLEHLPASEIETIITEARKHPA